MIVLDTTILVYAVGAEHPLAANCREVVRAVAEGEVRATTTPEVIQELAHVRARRRGRSDAVEVARSFATLLSPLLVVNDEDLAAGLALFERTTLGSFDAVLVASALRGGCRLLLSADRAFASANELPVANPVDADFLARMRSA
ncbi:MAG TPA: PIN domain-containing protein [Thermoanaerobaculia bacterium]|jgi:hypothetical protein|nr:PIN domain-containing protein [Thermoanaerobaculia bacterium]